MFDFLTAIGLFAIKIMVIAKLNTFETVVVCYLFLLTLKAMAINDVLKRIEGRVKND